jgi:hypothetical protein
MPVKENFNRFRSFWIQDASFMALLAVMIFTLFILPVLMEVGYADSFLMNTMLLIIFFVGIWSAYTRFTLVMSAILFSAHLLLRLFDSDERWILMTEDVVTAMNVLVFIVINFQLLFRDNRFSVERVLGAVNVYLLIALLGAILYNLIGLLFGSSLEGNLSISGDASDLPHYIYFSLVSLTTVGFGDIYPANHAAKMLSVALSAAGILYPAVVIAKLVSTYEGRGKED